jgi:hypothetical protein
MKTLKISVLAISLAVALAIPAMAQKDIESLASAKTHAFVWDSVNARQDIGTLGGKISYAPFGE